jgi:hypothetical protein
LTKRERYSPNQSFLFATLSSGNREAREEKKNEGWLDTHRINLDHYTYLLKSYNWVKLPNSGEVLVISDTKQYPKGYLWLN